MKIRLSPDELEHITQTAELLNISRSEYLRRQALTGTVGKPVIKLSYDSDTLSRTNAELTKQPPAKAGGFLRRLKVVFSG